MIYTYTRPMISVHVAIYPQEPICVIETVESGVIGVIDIAESRLISFVGTAKSNFRVPVSLTW
jgi:hypothetical protein